MQAKDISVCKTMQAHANVNTIKPGVTDEKFIDHSGDGGLLEFEPVDNPAMDYGQEA